MERTFRSRTIATLVQIAPHTRVTSIGYDELRTRVEFLVGGIKGISSA